jgi:hypothetical protein
LFKEQAPASKLWVFLMFISYYINRNCQKI